MTAFRPLAALLLALMLAITSQALAVARGQAPATGTMVLCLSGGLAAVAVDAQGNPVGPPHICPDAALHLAGAGAPVAVPAAPFVLGAAVVAAPAVLSLPPLPNPRPAARGPPAVSALFKT